MSIEEVNKITKKVLDNKGKDSYNKDDLIELLTILNRPSEDIENKADILLTRNQIQKQKLRTDIHKPKR